METSKQTYLTLTLSPFEAGVLKTLLGRLEIDDDADMAEPDYDAVNRAEDVLIDLANALATYTSVDVPTRYVLDQD